MVRQHFQLPEEDEDGLKAHSLSWEAVIDGQTKWLIIHNFPIPEGYNHRDATVALRIKPSYPDDDIDMAYFHPALALSNGRGIRQLTPCQIDGKEYQQWSRHRTSANPWRPGIDSVCSHLLQVTNWLEREIRG